MPLPPAEDEESRSNRDDEFLELEQRHDSETRHDFIKLTTGSSFIKGDDMSTAVDPIVAKQCGETTRHAELPGTGSCLCGFKKYAKPKVIDMNNLPTCGWCSMPPNIADIQTREVFCSTVGCPAFSNVVPVDRWCQRGVHEMEVMWIPAEEPIFVLRGRDPLAQVPVYTWIELAEKHKVPDYKTDVAVAQADAMGKYQTAGKSKMPD